ncbi:MAG: lycopene cyclase domain-containing protein [Chitinophagales bacterium]
MKYTYLLLNIFTILIPFLRSFEGKLRFYKKWQALLPAIIITAIFFLVWDYFKTAYGVWGFNPQYVIGYYVFGLPLEEILFFITVPYACAFIYETVSYFLREKEVQVNLKWPVRILGLVMFLTSFLLIGKAYTFSVLLIGGPVFIVATYLMSDSAFEKLIITYALSLVPMALVNGILTALPIVIYNNAQNLNVRLGTIPVEDFIYSSILLSMNFSLYEWQKRKVKTNYNQTVATA